MVDVQFGKDKPSVRMKELKQLSRTVRYREREQKPMSSNLETLLIKNSSSF